MKTRAPLVTLIALAAFQLAAWAETPAPGKQVAVQTLDYWLYFPSDYETKKSEKWPLVLFLHGSGERGNDLEKVKIHGPPKLVAAGKEFPFVLCSPQCPADTRWDAEQLTKLVDELANTHRIDRERLYVTGLSMGGGGTWALVAANPEKFAAAMPLCGRGDLANVEKLAKTPTWVLVGDQDRAETVENCKEMAAVLKKGGGEAKLTVYPGVGHDCWTMTYNNPEVYEWLLSHRRAGAK